MNDQEHKERLSRILEANKGYEGLMASPDFLRWKENVVDDHLDFLRNQLLASERSEPGWKERAIDRLVAYQEAVLTYETLIGMRAELSRQTRRDMKKLEEGER